VRIRPLTIAAVGVAFAAVDLRLVAWDVAPDAVGWFLVALACHRLTLRAPAGIALLAAFAGLAEIQLPYHYEALDPLTGEVVPNPAPGTSYHEELAFLPVDGVRLALIVASVVLGITALSLALRALHRRARTTTDAPSAHRLRLLSWAVPLGWGVPYVVVAAGQVVADGELDTVWNGGWELVAVLGLVVAGAVVALFATTANRRWSASGDEVGSPWAELMLRDAP
jgi:hypothetical protein